MSNHDSSNGGGYGNTGGDVTAQRQQAQTTNESTAPSARMAADFDMSSDTDPRPAVHNGQSQIAYDAEEE